MSPSSKSMSPSRRYMPSAPPGPSHTALSRSRTPEEAISGMYVGMAQVHALEGVTTYSVKALAGIDRMRQEVVEELPEINAIIWALEVNAARLIGNVQGALLGDTTTVIV